MGQYTQDYDDKMKERLTKFDRYVALSLEAEDPETIKQMIRAGYGILQGRNPDPVEAGPSTGERPKDLQAQVLNDAINKAKINGVANVGGSAVELSMVEHGSRIMDAPSVETTVDEEGDDLDLQAEGETDPLNTNATESQVDLDIASMSVKTPNRANENKVTLHKVKTCQTANPNFIGNLRGHRRLDRKDDVEHAIKYLKPNSNINPCVITNTIMLQLFFLQLGAIFSAIVMFKIYVSTNEHPSISNIATSEIGTRLHSNRKMRITCDSNSK